MERDNPYGFGGQVARVIGYPDSSGSAPSSASLMSTADRFHAAFGSQRKQPITTTEFRALVSAMQDDPEYQEMREISILVFCTALRAEELLRLCWNDVNFDSHEIFVTGNRDRDDRHIPFGKTTDAILRARRERDPRTRYVLGSSPERILEMVSQQLDALSIRVLNRHITLQSLRLGFMNWWSSVGGSPALLALIAGIRVRWSKPEGPSERLYVTAATFQNWLETLV